MESKNLSKQEKKKLLYTYWHDLPFRKNVDSENYFHVTHSDVKSFIIKYVRDGIEDDFGQSHGLRRHAFSVKELKKAYDNNSNGQEYTIYNFHFHVNNLVEDGYMKEIVKILEGRHYVSYYGRTAISFYPELDKDLSQSMVTDIFDPLKKLIADLNPELDHSFIDDLIEDNYDMITTFYDRMAEWTEEKYPHIYKSKLDLEAFTSYVAHYAMLNQALSQNLKRIGSLLGFDSYIESELENIGNEVLQ